MDIDLLNRAGEDEARAGLASCCGSSRWVERMLALRPFPDVPSLLAAAEEVWWDLTPDDWVEAFSVHPRIGEQPAGEDREAAWSRGEQSGVAVADAEVLEELAECNRAYEERFGHVFVVFASGRSAEELLALCRQRLGNDAVKEVTVAAAEQARITNLRLRRLLE